MTFAKDVMALSCMAAIWLNTLLICAHQWQRLCALRRLGRRLLAAGPGEPGLVTGQFESDGASGQVSYHLVQVGRGRGDGKIFFAERISESLVTGGAVRTEWGTVQLEVPGPGSAWVWPDDKLLAERLRCGSVEQYEELSAAALSPRGAERVLELPVTEGQQVFVAGLLSAAGDRVSAHGGALLISAYDPRVWVARQARLILAALLAILFVAGALTILACQPPAFGRTSQLGAALLLLYFFMVQPVGVWLTESVRYPHERSVRAVWERPHLTLKGS